MEDIYHSHNEKQREKTSNKTTISIQSMLWTNAFQNQHIGGADGNEEEERKRFIN